MNYASLEKVLSCPNLPSLPAVALRVLELTSKPDVELRQVANVIENDQAIAAKVLRTVNSSFYGLSRRCGSIQQALALLGLQTVKGLVLGFSLAKSIDGGGDKDVSFDFLSYWRRCMYSAAAARHLAQTTKRCDPDEAFVAALVQDIGMVALFRAFGDRYLQTLDLAGNDHRRLCAVERKSLDLDHAAVGGEMTSRWRFPDPIVQAVRYHHQSNSASVDAAQIVRTVELAGFAAAVILSDGARADENVTRFKTHAQEWFDLRGNQPLAMLQTIANLAEELARMFGLDVGEHPDVEGILKQAEDLRASQGLPDLHVEQEAAEVMETVDPVTGLADRKEFLRDLDLHFQVQLAPGAGIGLILVALDDVRKLNEQLGPQAGDCALKQVGELLNECLGKFGKAYRFVGAEFVACLPKVDLEQLCRIAETFRRKVSETLLRVDGSSGSNSASMTVTCGCAIYEGDPAVRANLGIESRDQLLRATMVALAGGQQAGKNRVVLYRRNQARPEAA